MIVRAEVRSLLSRASLIAGACIALAACHGGSPLPSAAPPDAPDSAGSIARSASSHKSIPVTLNLVVPTSKAASLRELGERNPFFVVFGTKGAKVVAYAHGDRTTPLARVIANVAGRSPVCSKGAARVCALKLSLKAAGKDDFVITTYDQSPSGGVIPVTAKQLAAGLEVKKIGPKGKTITAVVGGVVASTSLYLSQGAVSSIDEVFGERCSSRRRRKRDRHRLVRKCDGNAGQRNARLQRHRRHVVQFQSGQFFIGRKRARIDGKL
jgi:hypothetical protein